MDTYSGIYGKNMSEKRNHDFITIICASTISVLLLYKQTSLQTEFSREADLLNITKNLNQSILIYNRVPKAGSQLLHKLIDHLGSLNGFLSLIDAGELELIKTENAVIQTMNSTLQEEYVNMFDCHQENITPPIAFMKHMNFLDFEEFNKTNPIYINMIRHPIDRVISWYYYIRQGWYALNWNDEIAYFNDTQLNFDRALQPKRYKMTFEDCVLAQDPACTYPIGSECSFRDGEKSFWSQITFFCGMSSKCNNFASEEALKIAKTNVEKYYAVVGILERWQDSLQLLEHYVPSYFKNARNIYNNELLQKRDFQDNMKSEIQIQNSKSMDENQTYKRDRSPDNKNDFKVHTPEYIRSIIAKNFTQELEFYEFCKQRFQKQLLAIQYRSNPSAKDSESIKPLSVLHSGL